MSLSGMEEREKRKRPAGAGGRPGAGVPDIDGWPGVHARDQDAIPGEVPAA